MHDQVAHPIPATWLRHRTGLLSEYMLIRLSICSEYDSRRSPSRVERFGAWSSQVGFARGFLAHARLGQASPTRSSMRVSVGEKRLLHGNGPPEHAGCVLAQLQGLQPSTFGEGGELEQPRMCRTFHELR